MIKMLVAMENRHISTCRHFVLNYHIVIIQLLYDAMCRAMIILWYRATGLLSIWGRWLLSFCLNRVRVRLCENVRLFLFKALKGNVWRHIAVFCVKLDKKRERKKKKKNRILFWKGGKRMCTSSVFFSCVLFFMQSVNASLNALVFHNTQLSDPTHLYKW